MVSVFLLLFMLGSGIFLFYQKEGNRGDYLGKTPLCQMFAFTDKGLLYKDDILIKDMYEFKGLYLRECETSEEEEIVISDSYYGSANLKGECVYFVDYSYNIRRFFWKNGKQTYW